MTLFVTHQLLEQIHGHVVTRLSADIAGLFVQRTRVDLGREIAFEGLLGILTNPQRVELLKVWVTFEKMMRSISLSACCISSMLSSRLFLAIRPRPQSSCNR